MHATYLRNPTYHSVLSHQNDTVTTKGLSDLVHLLGADIVDTNDEDGGVLLKEALELLEVASFVFGSAPHIFLFEGRMFKGQINC
jgi:hypothetical protein